MVMLICIAGKNNIAVKVLEYLYYQKNSYELGVVCNKTERGENFWQRSLRWEAQRLGIKEYSLTEVQEIKEMIFLSLEYDRIIRPERFQTTKLYNIHFSLLPKYKGMYTSAIPILNGERVTGVTLHKIDAGIDTGDIIAQKSFEILESDTCREVYFKLIEKGTQLVIENLDDLLTGDVKAHPQSVNDSTYYSKDFIDYSELKIDMNQTACGIGRQIRAFSFREYQLPKILGESIVGFRLTNIKSKMKPGTLVFEDKRSLLVSTIDYNIICYKDRFQELLEACKIGDLELVMDICSAGFHINDRNEKGWSPLIVATYNNRKKVVYYLLSVGADIYAQNNNGVNLLMYAKEAYINTGDAALIRLFLTLGLSPQERDYRGKSLLDYIETEDCGKEMKEFLRNLIK